MTGASQADSRPAGARTESLGDGASQAPGAARPIVFENTWEVEPGHIDRAGHVNNVVYLRWVQAIATAHWEGSADPERSAAIVWVVLRHEIDYERPALPGDSVRVRTWVGEWRGVRTVRHTEILRADTGERLVRARSIWCALDAESRRPRRLDDDMWVPFFEEISSD